jgi:hypothetical protein
MELMDNLDPGRRRAIVDPALKLMTDAVITNSGYVVQSTSDVIFALFGATRTGAICGDYSGHMADSCESSSARLQSVRAAA